ncbi:MAG: TPM domain-containing protein [Brumimicrobium sp.]|nr:TPM domain-containing protein [Brumimicrobium sp.]MCO5268577.1 TPM domain-containing protein [Brumimicrobium sp.]
MSQENSFFTVAETEEILSAIQNAEKNTSGEIKLHVEKKCIENAIDRAVTVFNELGLEKTKQRNGVLFYIATEDRQFVILGDKGINEKVANGFWDDISDMVIAHFKQQDFKNGLIKGIIMAGEKLKTYFPYQKNDINEISDDLSFGDK